MTSKHFVRTFPGCNKVYLGDADLVKPGLQGGLFAAKNIKKGETIFVVKGKIIPIVIKSKKDSDTYPNAIGVAHGVWMDPEKNNPLVYLNHSCDANSGIKGRVTIVARKNIKKDEHITIDYSITESDELWILDKKCKCGSKKCRGVVKSVQSLPKIVYNKYMPYIPSFIQKEYARAKSK